MLAGLDPDYERGVEALADAMRCDDVDGIPIFFSTNTTTTTTTTTTMLAGLDPGYERGVVASSVERFNSAAVRRTAEE